MVSVVGCGSSFRRDAEVNTQGTSTCRVAGYTEYAGVVAAGRRLFVFHFLGGTRRLAVKMCREEKRVSEDKMIMFSLPLLFTFLARGTKQQVSVSALPLEVRAFPRSQLMRFPSVPSPRPVPVTRTSARRHARPNSRTPRRHGIGQFEPWGQYIENVLKSAQPRHFLFKNPLVSPANLWDGSVI